MGGQQKEEPQTTEQPVYGNINQETGQNDQHFNGNVGGNNTNMGSTDQSYPDNQLPIYGNLNNPDETTGAAIYGNETAQGGRFVPETRKPVSYSDDGQPIYGNVTPGQGYPYETVTEADGREHMRASEDLRRHGGVFNQGYEDDANNRMTIYQNAERGPDGQFHVIK